MKEGKDPPSKTPNPFAKLLKSFPGKDVVEKLLQIIKVGSAGGSGGPIDMGDAAKPVASPRAMKFPYTFGAKLAQFPYKFMADRVWPFKYYMIGIAVALPIFYKIGKKSYDPVNVRNWEHIRQGLFTPGHH